MEDGALAAVKQVDNAIREILHLGAEAGAELTNRVRELTGIHVAPTAFSVLRELQGNAFRLSQLVTLLGLAQPTVTLCVQDLERKGLITRSRNEDDRRGWMLELSERGREVLATLECLRDSQLSEIFAGWNENDVLSLAQLLTRFKHDMARAIHSDGASRCVFRLD